MKTGHVRTVIALDDQRFANTVHSLRVALSQQVFDRDTADRVTDLLCKNIGSLFGLVKTRTARHDGPVIFSCSLQPTGTVQHLIACLLAGDQARFLAELETIDRQRVLRYQSHEEKHQGQL